MTNTFTSRMNKAMLAGLTAAVFAMPIGAQSNVALEQLTALAASATTPAQHADVAERFRLQSEAFEAQAAEHEKNAQLQMRTLNAMAQKGHRLTSRSVQTHKAKAVEARRAAQEAMAVANHHLRLSAATAVARE